MNTTHFFHLLLFSLVSINLNAGVEYLSPLVGVRDLQYIEGRFVAISERALLTSVQGDTWERHPLPQSFSSFQFLAYGKGIFVLGSDLDIYSSTDLVTFNRSSVSRTQDVHFDGERFLLATSWELLASPDGLVWNQVAPGDYRSIASFNGTTVALGGSGAVVSSGGAFTPVAGVSPQLSWVVAGPTGFVAMGYNGVMSRSTDGLNWTPLVQTALASLTHVSYVGNKYWAFDFEERVFSSDDGVEWHEFADGNNQSTLVTSNGQHVFLLGAQFIRINANGDLVPLGLGNQEVSLITVFKNTIYASQGWHVLATQDGKIWVPAPNFPSTGPLYQDEDILLMRDLSVTQDGQNWDRLNVDLYNITYGFVDAAGYTLFGRNSSQFTVAKSADGEHWTYHRANIPIPSELIRCNGIYLAHKSYDESIYRSLDGISWEYLSIGEGRFRGLFSEKGRILITGEKVLYQSEDGYHFTPYGSDYQLYNGKSGFWRTNNQGVSYSATGRHWTVPSQEYPVPHVLWKGKGLGITVGGLISYDLPNQFLRTMVLPWIVDNESWHSQIVLSNLESHPVTAVLKATPMEGEPQVLSVEIDPHGMFSRTPSELFPGLTRFSLVIESFGQIYSTFLTYADVNGVYSPSQAAGSNLEEMSRTLVFPYFDRADLNAIALVAPLPPPTGDQNVTDYVSVVLRNEAGQVIAERNLLMGVAKPMAGLVRDIFNRIELPEHFSIEVTSYRPICGTSFIFNDQGQPSMDNGLPVFKE